MAKKDSKKENKKQATGKEFFAKNRMLVGIVMVVCSIILSLFVLPGLSDNVEYTIYTVKSSISSGAFINESMLEETKTSDKKLSEKAVTPNSKEALNEYVAVHNIEAGSYLLWSNISKSDGTGGTDKVPTGKQIISIPVNSISTAVSYTIRKGDIIRFYSTYDNEKGERIAYIPENLRYVEVYEVYDSGGIPTAQSGAAPVSISLIVTHDQGLDIVTLMNESKCYYSLMSSGDSKNAEKFLNMQEKILNGEMKAEDESVNLSEVQISGSVNTNSNNKEQ